MTGFDNFGTKVTSKIAFTASTIGAEAVEGRVLELIGQYGNKMSVTNDFHMAPGAHI